MDRKLVYYTWEATREVLRPAPIRVDPFIDRSRETCVATAVVVQVLQH